jgi:hypothetical protein
MRRHIPLERAVTIDEQDPIARANAAAVFADPTVFPGLTEDTIFDDRGNDRLW